MRFKRVNEKMLEVVSWEEKAKEMEAELLLLVASAQWYRRKERWD